MEDWIVYLINVLIVLTVFLGWAFYQRTKYARETEGHILAQFFTDGGRKYKKIIPYEPNGIEIKAPRGHICPRYFFNKESTFHVKYPENPLLGMKFFQVDIPSVEWAENNPEPINPYAVKPVVTAGLIDAIRDEDFAAFALAANKEIQELQRALAKALAEKVPKMTFYVLIGFAIIMAIVAAGLSYQNFDLLNYVIERGGF